MPEASAALPLAGRTVLGIFAHPDDESLACGGTLARLADAGCRVVIVCASHGEAGSISDPALVPDGNLGTVRVGELRDAAAVLGAAETIVLDHPDGDLRWDHVPEMHAEIGVLALDANRTQLSFKGRYDPPLGPPGRGIDHALLHRVAGATARDFLDRLV